MKLYLISQTKNNDYDTYDKAIVAAPNIDAARRIHPAGKPISDGDKYGSWVTNPNDVFAEFIGRAKGRTKPGVILASFNAG